MCTDWNYHKQLPTHQVFHTIMARRLEVQALLG